jgi:hypothetical protein
MGKAFQDKQMANTPGAAFLSFPVAALVPGEKDLLRFAFYSL